MDETVSPGTAPAVTALQATGPLSVAPADEMPPGVLVENDTVPVETFAQDPDPAVDWLDPSGIGQTREPVLPPAPPEPPGGPGYQYDYVSPALAALDIARAELGTIGGSKYKQYWNAPSTAAWCGYFACWVLRKAGITDGPATGWTPNIVQWGKDRGKWKTADAHPGDLILFMWPTVSKNGRGTPPVCHVGLVETVNADGTLTTIEGNTSAKVNGSQYNGNVCARKVRKSNVVGFVTIFEGSITPQTADPVRQDVQSILHGLGFYTGPIDGVTDPTAAVTAFQLAAGLVQDGTLGPVSRAAAALVPPFPGSTEQGQTSAATKAYQQRLHDRGAVIDVDGIHGPQTSSVLRSFQQAHGLEVDGIGGPQTWTALYTRAA